MVCRGRLGRSENSASDFTDEPLSKRDLSNGLKAREQPERSTKFHVPSRVMNWNLTYFLRPGELVPPLKS